MYSAYAFFFACYTARIQVCIRLYAIATLRVADLDSYTCDIYLHWRYGRRSVTTMKYKSPLYEYRDLLLNTAARKEHFADALAQVSQPMHVAQL